MSETRSTRHRRRIERRRRGIVFLVAVGLLLADIAAAASGLIGGGGQPGGRSAKVATDQVAPGSTTTSVATTTTSSTSTTVATTRGASGTSAAGARAATPTVGAPGTAGGCGFGACVTLNAAQTTGAFSHVGAGINELPGGSPSAANLRSLGTTMYRSVPVYKGTGQFDWTAWDAAVAGGAKTTLILSGLWTIQSGQAYPPTPWSNWDRYNTWVKSTVATIAASGREVDFWDIFSEPGWYSYYSASDFASETPDDLLQQFLYTYQDIKSVEPSAQIVGPSLGIMTFAPIPTNSDTWKGTHQFDMTTFLQFCAQHNLQLAAVAWHQNGASPQMLDQWAAQTWALIRSLPALGRPAMYIDEYAEKPMQPVPGWDVGYLADLASADVAYSVRSCWDGCRASTLDGLLLANGATTSSWIERLAYARMSGQTVTSSSSDPNLPALGSVAPGHVTALIGRMTGCGSPAYWCNQFPYPWFGTFGAESVGVSVILPWTAGNVHIKLSHVSSQPGNAVGSATVDSPTGVRLSPDGTGRELLSFSLPSFADGDAYILDVTSS